MRNETITALKNYAIKNSDVMLLTADLGYSVLEQFSDVLPEQYANVGVCEQAMVGIAAGLALTGRRVVIYSIANFPTLRCLEQLRNDVCYHNLPVVVIAVGGGLSYGAQGYTHHGIEDLGIMSMLPNIMVTCPADPIESVCLLPQLLDRRAPGYMRLGRSGEPLIHDEKTVINLNKAKIIRQGSDLAILSTGPILARAINAASVLESEGFSCSIYSFPCVHPLDAETVEHAARNHRAIISVEEHNLSGGFGTRVADLILELGLSPKFRKFGITKELIGNVGSQDWLLNKLGPIQDMAREIL